MFRSNVGEKIQIFRGTVLAYYPETPLDSQWFFIIHIMFDLQVKIIVWNPETKV